MKYISANMCGILIFFLSGLSAGKIGVLMLLMGVFFFGEVAAMSGPGNGSCAKSIAQNSLPPLRVLPSKLLRAGRVKG